MTTEEAMRGIKDAEMRIGVLKEVIRNNRRMNKLLISDTMTGKVYRALITRTRDTPAMTPSQLVMHVCGSSGTKPQYFSVEAALRNLRTFGAVKRLGHASYAATALLVDTDI